MDLLRQRTVRRVQPQNLIRWHPIGTRSHVLQCFQEAMSQANQNQCHWSAKNDVIGQLKSMSLVN